MTNPNFRGYEVKIKRKGEITSITSGAKGRLFPGGSGAPPGYVGSWQTGFTRSPIAGHSWVDVVPALPSTSPNVVAPPAQAASPRASTPSIATPRASTPSAMSPPVDDRARNPIPGVVHAVGQRRHDTPPRHRSRSPPIYVLTSPSTPVTPERTWGNHSVVEKKKKPLTASPSEESTIVAARNREW